MKLTIYLKSGNQITADAVTDWKVKYNSEQITYIQVFQKTEGFFKCKNRLIVSSINLKQIECIVEH